MANLKSTTEQRRAAARDGAKKRAERLAKLQDAPQEIRGRKLLLELRHAFTNAGAPNSDIASGPWAEFILGEIEKALVSD